MLPSDNELGTNTMPLGEDAGIFLTSTNNTVGSKDRVDTDQLCEVLIDPTKLDAGSIE